ncbi:MAG TPA: hypothetical protein VKY54_15380 [Kiloniellales bacterium]|nr:hypothetical protein [Kiloniellales bacterium]
MLQLFYFANKLTHLPEIALPYKNPVQGSHRGAVLLKTVRNACEFRSYGLMILASQKLGILKEHCRDAWFSRLHLPLSRSNHAGSTASFEGFQHGCRALAIGA